MANAETAQPRPGLIEDPEKPVPLGLGTLGSALGLLGSALYAIEVALGHVTLKFECADPPGRIRLRRLRLRVARSAVRSDRGAVHAATESYEQLREPGPVRRREIGLR